MSVKKIVLAVGAGSVLALSACIPDEPGASASKSPAVTKPPENKGDVRTAPDANQLGSVDGKDPKELLATVEAMKAQLKDKPRDFAVDMALGNLFYDNGRYVEALEYYRDASK